MIVTVASRKGGVGKTTTAVSLATAFAEAGYPSLLVDLDSQASASHALGLLRAELVPSVYDVLFRNVPIEQAVRSTTVAQLFLLPASVDLLHADLELAHRRHKDQILAQALHPLRDRFQMMILDCPPALGLLVQGAFLAAEVLLVPCSPHPLALEGLDVTLELARRTRFRAGVSPLPAYLLLTQVEQRTRLGRRGWEALTGLAQQGGAHVLETKIPWTVRIAEAPALGLPVLVTDPAGVASCCYRQAARELALCLGLGDFVLHTMPAGSRADTTLPSEREPESNSFTER